MDGLSGTASVIAVIQITTSISSALMDYYATVRDAKEEMQKLYHAIKSLESSPPSTISSTGLVNIIMCSAQLSSTICQAC